VTQELSVFRYRFQDSRVFGTGVSESVDSPKYYLDDAPIARSLCTVLPPLLADLVDVAAAVHVVDRLARRRRDREAHERRFEVEIPVRTAERWNALLVRQSLTSLLSFMTGDSWSLQFVPEPIRRRPSETQHSLFALQKDVPNSVGLFSGGLDSLAGTAAAIARKPDQHVICVSCSSNKRQERPQRIQAAALRSQLAPHLLSHIRIPYWLQSATNTVQDSSRRTRGFLFLAFGSATALAADGNRLYVYENGVGAINLPYEAVPVGVPYSRAVHPWALLLFSRFIRALTGSEFHVENPCLFQTKAQMCSDPSISELVDVVAQTFSCDGFPVRRAGKPQCGVCTSCILRRLALYGSKLNRIDQSGYGADLYSRELFSSQRLRGLFSMDWQVGRLQRALSEAPEWPRLISEFPELRLVCDALSASGLPERSVQDGLVGLYARHCAEWESCPMKNALERKGRVA